MVILCFIFLINIYKTWRYQLRTQLTTPQVMRRSFHFYNKDKSRNITEKDILNTLYDLGKIEGKFEPKGI